MGRFFESIGAIDSERFYSAALGWALGPDCHVLRKQAKIKLAGLFLPEEVREKVDDIGMVMAESRLADLRIQALSGKIPINIVVENKLKATFSQNQLQKITKGESIDGQKNFLCTLTLFEDDTHERLIPDTSAINVTYRDLYEAFSSPELKTDNEEDTRQAAILQEFRDAIGRIASLRDLFDDSTLWAEPLLRLIPRSIGRSKDDRLELWDELKSEIPEEVQDLGEMLIRWGFDKPFIRAHFQTIAAVLNGPPDRKDFTWEVGGTHGKPHISRVLSPAQQRDKDEVKLNWGIQVQFPHTCKLVLAIRDGYPTSTTEQIKERVKWLKLLLHEPSMGSNAQILGNWQLNHPRTRAYCSLSCKMPTLVGSDHPWWIGDPESCSRHLQTAAEHLQEMVREIEGITDRSIPV